MSNNEEFIETFASELNQNVDDKHDWVNVDQHSSESLFDEDSTENCGMDIKFSVGNDMKEDTPDNLTENEASVTDENATFESCCDCQSPKSNRDSPKYDTTKKAPEKEEETIRGGFIKIDYESLCYQILGTVKQMRKMLQQVTSNFLSRKYTVPLIFVLLSVIGGLKLRPILTSDFQQRCGEILKENENLRERIEEIHRYEEQMVSDSLDIQSRYHSIAAAHELELAEIRKEFKAMQGYLTDAMHLCGWWCQDIQNSMSKEQNWLFVDDYDKPKILIFPSEAPAT